MSRNLRLYLTDIMTSCAKVLRYTQDITFEELITDERTYDAVLLNLQIIGEAVKHIPLNIREHTSGIEWRKIAGLRDVVAHTYFQIEPEIIWDIGQTKIQPLQKQVQQLLEHELDDR